MNEIHVPGPGTEGFRVHILTDQTCENVLLIFGEEINHLPMPPPIAWKLAQEILSKAVAIDPESRLQIRDRSISVQVYERQVLLETRKPISELVLSPSEARELTCRLCEESARAVGRPLPPDFPLERH